MSGSTATRVGLTAGAGVAAGSLLWNTAETRASIEWAWTFFTHIVKTGPIGLWAVVLAVLAGWLVMLRVSLFPLHCLSREARTAWAQLAGMLASFSVVWFLWRDPLGLIIGALVGLSTPYTWSLVLILLELCPGEWARRWAADLRGTGQQVSLPFVSTGKAGKHDG